MPVGLLSARYTRFGFGRSVRPSTRTSSLSFTCVPSTAGAPLTVTRPASIH